MSELQEYLELAREFGGWFFALLFYLDFREILLRLEKKFDMVLARLS